MDFDQEIIEIIPNGDVELVVPRPQPASTTGDDTSEVSKSTRVIVSSLMLMTHSSMFLGMLADNFQEGQNLKKDGRVSVPLPDDKPKAVARLCALIHNMTNLVEPLRNQFEDLKDIVSLSQKWDTNKIVGVHLERIAFRAPDDKSTIREMLERMFLAYKIGAQGPFEAYCKFILEQRPLGSRLNVSLDCSADIYFCYMIEQMNSVRQEAHITLLKAMGELTEGKEFPLLVEWKFCHKCRENRSHAVRLDQNRGFLVKSGFCPSSKLGIHSIEQLHDSLTFWNHLGVEFLENHCRTCYQTELIEVKCGRGQPIFDALEKSVDQAKIALEAFNTCVPCIELGPGGKCHSCQEDAQAETKSEL